MPPPFLPGLELSRLFYVDAVRPLLDDTFPGLPHAAARIGGGSEVLGFDTQRSTDHEWGPRLQLFLHPAQVSQYAASITDLLAERLPKSFLGYPTHFEPVGERITRMSLTSGPVNHRVDITDLGTWFAAHLGFDPRWGVELCDWLATPSQRLAETTAGAVFHDGLGDLDTARARLRWYPRQVWLYLLACGWQRISEEEAFVGRCAEVGDDIGSAVIAARLVRDIMRLCLLMARRYPPYGKWLGSAFARLPRSAALMVDLTAVVTATEPCVREQHLANAYRTTAELHNALAITEPVDPNPRAYHGRPYRVLHAERLTAAIRARICDARLRALPLVGSVDQFVDSTEVLSQPPLARAVAGSWWAGPEPGPDQVWFDPPRFDP